VKRRTRSARFHARMQSTYSVAAWPGADLDDRYSGRPAGPGTTTGEPRSLRCSVRTEMMLAWGALQGEMPGFLKPAGCGQSPLHKPRGDSHVGRGARLASKSSARQVVKSRCLVGARVASACDTVPTCTAEVVPKGPRRAARCAEPVRNQGARNLPPVGIWHARELVRIENLFEVQVLRNPSANGEFFENRSDDTAPPNARRVCSSCLTQERAGECEFLGRA